MSWRFKLESLNAATCVPQIKHTALPSIFCKEVLGSPCLVENMAFVINLSFLGVSWHLECNIAGVTCRCSPHCSPLTHVCPYGSSTNETVFKIKGTQLYCLCGVHFFNSLHTLNYDLPHAGWTVTHKVISLVWSRSFLALLTDTKHSDTSQTFRHFSEGVVVR